MADEQATSPEGEVADQIPAAEPRDDNAAADLANGIATETDADGEEVTVEEIELDVAGTKHKLKKGTPVEDAVDLIQQYGKGLEASLTRKGQEIGEARKAIEDQFKLANRMQGLRGEQLAVYAQGERDLNEIQRLEKYDLNALWQSNPDQARQLSDRLGQLRSSYQTAYAKLAQYGEHLNATERQMVESRAVEGEQFVTKAIKGFGPAIEREMVEYAVKNGVPEQDAKMWRVNPYAAVTTWKAMQFDKLQSQAKAATKTPAVPAPAAPVTAIRGGRGGSSSAPDLEKMDMDAYAAYRRKQDSRRSR
jgi:hypothetical protein